MNKTVVIYGSKYGATKQYAGWIADELSAELIDVKKADAALIDNADTIIVGGALYAGGVKGLSFIINNYDKLKDKQLVLFTCGIADPQNEANAKKIHSDIAKRVPPEMLKNIRIFNLRGAIDYSKLSFVHRAMMAVLKKSLEKKPASQLSDEDRQLIETYGKKVDFIDKGTITPIIDLIKHS